MSNILDTDYILSYAKNREDVVLGSLLEQIKKGFYVDIYSEHPTHNSITKYFYDHGWDGINIERTELLYELFQQHRTRDINVHVKLRDNQTRKSGRDGILESVFIEHNIKDIHFMSVNMNDSGSDMIVGIDWKTYRPWVVCISVATPDLFDDLFNSYNYVRFLHDGLNSYYVSKEQGSILVGFSYQKAISNKPILTPIIETSLRYERISKEAVTRQVNKLKVILDQTNSQLTQLQNSVASSRRIRGSVKQLLFSIDNVIITRIENLNKPMSINKYNEPSKKINSKTTDGLIKAIKIYDFDRYYLASSSKRLAYRFANYTYQSTTRRLMRLLKIIIDIKRDR